jgi:hypothetical protein
MIRGWPIIDCHVTISYSLMTYDEVTTPLENVFGIINPFHKNSFYLDWIFYNIFSQFILILCRGELY